jgi:hypothetical protein
MEMTDDEAIEFERLKTARDGLLLTVAKLRGDIDTLYEMYRQASRQRDELLDEQGAMIAKLRGNIQ